MFPSPQPVKRSTLLGPAPGTRRDLHEPRRSPRDPITDVGSFLPMTSPREDGHSKLRLFGLSFLMLFVELALIRWTGANIIYLSYFSNLVLLGSFLGIGLGFLRSRSRVDLFRWAPLFLALLVLFVLVFPVHIDNAGTELLFFGSPKTSGLSIWVTLPI